uniref:Putative amphid protein n=1 Tax=Globodera rostochiensis TaxID=31243 RepID=A0A023NCQ2_GLORO|nr:putative amphid protein [Globodera rostochiensis]
MQFSFIILSSFCLYVGALPRLNELHYKAKHGGERGQKSDAQPQQMPRRLPFPRPGPMPEYLQDASEKAQFEYQQMFAEDNGQTPKGELKAKLAKWAESNGMKKEFDMHQEEYQRKKEAFHKLMTANLGGEALRVSKKIWEITHNDELSRNDECQQLQDVLDV